MQILEDHNKQLESQLQRLRELLLQVRLELGEGPEKLPRGGKLESTAKGRNKRARWQWLLDDFLKRIGLTVREGGGKKGLVCPIARPILGAHFPNNPFESGIERTKFKESSKTLILLPWHFLERSRFGHAGQDKRVLLGRELPVTVCPFSP